MRGRLLNGLGRTWTYLTTAHRFGCIHSLWEFRFQRQEPEWAATGILPGTGRHSCQTWKQLYFLAFHLYVITEQGSLGTPQMAFQRLEKLWNSGDGGCIVVIRIHMCRADNHVSQQAQSKHS